MAAGTNKIRDLPPVIGCSRSGPCSAAVKLGGWAHQLNEVAETIDRILRAVWSALAIHLNISVLRSESCNPSVQGVAVQIDTARSVISTFRALPSAIKVLTGKLFWSEETVSGEKRIVRRAWVIVAMDLMATVARLLSPLTWLNRLGAIDLGKHASWMGTTIGSLFAAATVVQLANGIKNWVMAGKDQLGEAIANFFSDLFDLLSLPWDLGYCLHSPGLSIAGACLMGVSSAVWLVKETF